MRKREREEVASSLQDQSDERRQRLLRLPWSLEHRTERLERHYEMAGRAQTMRFVADAMEFAERLGVAVEVKLRGRSVWVSYTSEAGAMSEAQLKAAVLTEQAYRLRRRGVIGETDSPSAWAVRPDDDALDRSPAT